MNAVLEWVKANVFIVVFVVLMLAAGITLPIFASGMNKKVSAEVSNRAQNFAKLAQLEKSEILPGQTGVPNERTLQRYEQVAKVIAEDAANVRKAAVEHNRKDRGVLIPRLFPEPPSAEAEVLPKQFHEKLMDAYGELLREINAGTPPTLEGMRDQLVLARQQFILQELKKDTSQALEPDEAKRLRDYLSDHRLSICVDGASRTGIFLSSNELGVPGWNQANQPSLGELFNWQWQYWIVSDVLRALHEANKADQTVSKAPVKQVLSLVVSGLPAPADASSSAGSGGSGRMAPRAGFGGPGAGDGGHAPPPQGDSASTGGAPFNPKAPVQKDFAASITGRTSNGLYDVVFVELDMVVETARLPQVLDALARYNFMTVTNLSLQAADAFAALQDGYFYGTGPVSTVRLTLETVWLREWTTQYMPKAIKQALGVAATPDAGAAPPDA